MLSFSRISLFMVIVCIACKESNDDPTPNPQVQLQKTWQMGTTGQITKDGVAVTDEYTGFNITFHEDGTYVYHAG